jgi:hypothetical protein
VADDNDPWGERAAATLAWIGEHGVVLQSARGPVPNVAQFIAGEPIDGSWWGHRAGTEIYAILNVLDDSPDLVSTRLINGKVTLLHRRIWPNIVRVAELLDVAALSAIHSEHTASGAHHNVEIEYPLWVPDEVVREAASLGIEDAFASLPECLRI